MLDNVIEMNAALNTLAAEGLILTIDELASLWMVCWAKQTFPIFSTGSAKFCTPPPHFCLAIGG
jgi:hypothetical protein